MMEPTHEGLDFDLSEAEKLINRAATEQATEKNEEQSPPADQSDPVGAVAKGKARALVRMLENLWRMKEPRLRYEDSTYQEAEDQLAPVLQKHELSEVGPMKYAEEVNALGFIGGLAVQSFVAVRQFRQADEEAKRKADSGQQS